MLTTCMHTMYMYMGCPSNEWVIYLWDWRYDDGVRLFSSHVRHCETLTKVTEDLPTICIHLQHARMYMYTYFSPVSRLSLSFLYFYTCEQTFCSYTHHVHRAEGEPGAEPWPPMCPLTTFTNWFYMYYMAPRGTRLSVDMGGRGREANILHIENSVGLSTTYV